MTHGERFSDKYIVGDSIGEGGFASVHIAHNLQGEIFAVKIVDKRSLVESDIISCRREADYLRQLSPHPHIVQIYDFYEESDYMYLVLEYLEGGELYHEIIHRTFYTEKDARNVIKIILETLKYIHSFGIVHRDLKVENLLLTDRTPQATIKIADFGLAGVKTDARGLYGMLGTVAYMAPEIIKGNFYNKAVDVWAVGVIAFALLSGALPFNSSNEGVLKNKILRGQFEFREELWYVVSPLGKSFVRELLIVNASRRLTVEEALNHDWFKLDEALLSRKRLTFSTAALVGRIVKKWRLRTQQRKLLREQDEIKTAAEQGPPVSSVKTELDDGKDSIQIHTSDAFTEPPRVDNVVVRIPTARQVIKPEPEKGVKSGLDPIQEHGEEKETPEEEEEVGLKTLFSIQSQQSGYPSFSIVEELEKHYHSTLFTGINNLTQEEVLVEVFDVNHIPKPVYKLLQNEIAVVTSLPCQHKNILHFYSISYETDKCYVVQEKLLGKELLDRLAENTSYAEKEVKAITLALLSAIGFLHENNVVHRAISPENIIFASDSYDAEIKLLNFRAAKKLEPAPHYGRSITHSTAYTAPELIHPNAILNALEKASDLWSLGVVLYLLLIGKNPFPQFQETDLETAIVDHSISFDDEIGWNVISPAAKDLVKKLLDKNPLSRLTATQALNHEWFKESDEELVGKEEGEDTKKANTYHYPHNYPDHATANPLAHSLSNLKRLHAKKKFQRAIRAVIFVGRVHKAVEAKNALLKEQQGFVSISLDTLTVPETKEEDSKKNGAKGKAKKPIAVSIRDFFSDIYKSFKQEKTKKN